MIIKVKKLIAVSLSMLIIISALLIVFPFIEQENLRNTLNKNPMQAGSTFVYDICSFAEYTYGYHHEYPQFNLTNGFDGSLILKVNPNNTMEFNHCVLPDEYGATKPIFSSNTTLGENTKLVKWFLNDVSLSTPFININGVIEKKGNNGLPYRGYPLSCLPSKFDHLYCAQLIKDNGFTSPTVLNALNINDCGMNTSKDTIAFHYPNSFCYDQAGNYNVLVGAKLCGNVSLARTFCGNQNVFLSEGFSIRLAATNVGLHPLARNYYLPLQTNHVLIIWLIGVPILVVTINAAKKRVTGNKR